MATAACACIGCLVPSLPSHTYSDACLLIFVLIPSICKTMTVLVTIRQGRSLSCTDCCLAGEFVGSSMGFIQDGGITASSGASGTCGGSPSGPTAGRAGYPGYGPPSYAYPPVAVPAYYYPPVVRSQLPVIKPAGCRGDAPTRAC